MDENAGLPTSTTPLTGAPNTVPSPQGIPSTQGIPSQQVPQQTGGTASNAGGGARLTLEDLYGPSQQSVPQQAPQQPQQMPVAPNFQQQPSTSPFISSPASADVSSPIPTPAAPVAPVVPVAAEAPVPVPSMPVPPAASSPAPASPSTQVSQETSPSVATAVLLSPAVPAISTQSQEIQSSLEEVEQPAVSKIPEEQSSAAPQQSSIAQNAPVGEEASSQENTEATKVTEQQVSSRRNLEAEASKLVQAAPGQNDSGEPPHKEPKNNFATLLRFLVGGVVAIIILMIVWGVSSMIFSGKGNQSGKVNLTYWGLWEDANVMQPIFDDFQKQHPNITITYTKQDPKDYTKRLLTRAQDGTGPDIFRFHNTWVYPLQSLLLPLPTQVIGKQDFDTNYPPVVAHDLVQNGAVYGLPLQMDTLAMFVNTDILTHAGASVPVTWDNFITVAKALTVKDPAGKIKTAGAAIGTYENIAHAPDIVSVLLLQNGANLTKLSPSQNANDALTFYTTFAHGDSNIWDGTLDNSMYAFARGKVAIYFGYSFDIFAIKAIAPSLNFSIHPVPHLPGRDMTMASYWVEGVSNRSKHQKEALTLLQYLAQKDVQAKLYTEEAKTRSFGELYARTDLADGLKGNPLLEPFVSQYKNAQSSFFTGDTSYEEYNGSMNRYLGNAINSMVQDTSVDSAMQTLSQGVSQVMNTYAPKTQ